LLFKQKKPYVIAALTSSINSSADDIIHTKNPLKR
jgi:hypothetical protein